MRPRRGNWIKPLLEATRADIEADLERIGQQWREDRSNLDLHYTRNRVRHLAIPALLRSLAPGFDTERARAGLVRRAVETSREAREVVQAVGGSAYRLLFRLCRIQSDGVTIDAVSWDAIRWR